MNVLFVANHNKGVYSSFVIEQMRALSNSGISTHIYGIEGHGFMGYWRNISDINKSVRLYQPDLIHAHYGLSGLCANLQRKIPVVTTYHGSDIHSEGWVLKLSQLAMKLSAHNIFVSEKIKEMAGYKRKNSSVLPCGLDLNIIKEIPRRQARKELGLDINEKIGLFSGSYDNHIKNYPLARAAIAKMKDVRLIELKDYSRQEVNLLMNAVDFQLTTSIRESGPLVVKEAMACGTPVVSVDVGDVKDIIGNTKGCYIADHTPDDLVAKIRLALSFTGKTTGRQRIIDLGLSNDYIAKKIIAIYEEVLNEKDIL